MSILSQILVSEGDAAKDTIVVIFSLCIVIWSATMLEYWKR